ncbi:hypothetical protein MTX78_12100 [Hymenobacter tibetensis]|uniref:DUF7684 domain-containing protein n=1 Tax=Hymenobacter tibetensis TaxID=497967 RepID=A0ABY4CUL3_9BACT|nr:hypothetical protein [Hymenobacter tibetensis]UOG72870.1 hypothetical protein MTX78_12100 [Hymenobacter tibetensis]
MNYVGQQNGRDIYYFTTEGKVDWNSKVFESSWLLFAIGDDPDKEVIIAFVDECIAHKPAYICTAGKACELIHDSFDEGIIWQGVEHSSIYAPMTTWHDDFKEGIWFAVNVACHEELVISKVVCINLDSKSDIDKSNLMSALS